MYRFSWTALIQVSTLPQSNVAVRRYNAIYETDEDLWGDIPCSRFPLTC